VGRDSQLKERLLHLWRHDGFSDDGATTMAVLCGSFASEFWENVMSLSDPLHMCFLGERFLLGRLTRSGRFRFS
jgi:hypothetical protein